MAFFERFNRSRVSNEDLSQKSDKYLIRAYCADGNLDFVSVLFSRYVHLVFGCSLKYLEDEQDARDSTMAVFEKLTKELKTHGASIKEFRPWLYVLTKNLALMKLRKSKREKEIFIGGENELKSINNHVEFEVAWHPIGENDDDLEEVLVNLNQCLEQLPDLQQVSIREFYLNKKSYAQIGQAHDLPVNKVKSYIQNGKRNLKKCIENARGEPRTSEENSESISGGTKR